MKKKHTIALLTSLLTNPLSMDILEGVNEELSDSIELVTFTGGALGDRKHIEWIDVSGNIIYDLVKIDRFDGVIIYGGAIGQYISRDEFKRFCNKFKPLPVVVISLNIEGIPSVSISNYTGVYDIVEHMIKVHKSSKIGYIKGPEGHEEAEERYHGYIDALKNNNIEFNSNFVTEGSFSVYSGRTGVMEFLDHRNLDLDTIVCADDDTALGAMAAIKERGLIIPDDIAVVGFDDISFAISTIPTLTTVKQPFKELGKEALNLILRIIDKQDVDMQVKIPSCPVIRDSCGCFEDLYFEEKLLLENKTIWEQDHLDIIDSLLNEFSSEIVINRNFLEKIIQRIEDHFLYPESNKLFGIFNNLLGNQKSIVKSLAKINSFIIYIVTYLGKKKGITKDQILLIIEQLRVKLYIGAYRERLLDNLQVEEHFFDINNINQMLHNNATFKGLYKDTFKFFNSFGIKACYIVLFEEVNKLGKQVRLAFGFKDDEMFNIENSLSFSVNKLLPDEYFNLSRRNTIVTSLSSNKETMGYIIFDMGNVPLDMSHALSWYYGSIFKRNFILKESKQKTVDLENTLSTLRKTQTKLIESEKLAALGSLVAGVAHELNTPLGTSITYSTFIEEQINKIENSFNTNQLTKSFFTEQLDSLSLASKGIYTSLSKVAELIKSFKDVAIFNNFDKPEDFQLSDIIYEVIDDFKITLKTGLHQVSVDCPDNICIHSYKKSVFNIILGLFNNSISHGFIDSKKGRISISVIKRDGNIVIDFKDNGVGIPETDFGKVFEPFYTTKRGKGFIGLGLHTIHNIVTQLLHGTIELNPCSSGTHVIIELPTDSKLEAN